MADTPPPPPDDFAAALKRARRAAGLSQADLGRRVGLTGSYVCMLELRRKPAPTSDVVEKLAKALAVAPALLLDSATLERTPEHVRARMARLTRDRVRARRRRDRLVSTAVFHLARRPGFVPDRAATVLGLPLDYRPAFFRLADRLRHAPSERAAERTGRRELAALPMRERDAMVEAIPRLLQTDAEGTTPATADPPRRRPWQQVPVLRSPPSSDAQDVVDVLHVDRRLWRPGAYLLVAADDDAFPRVERGDWLLVDARARPADGDLIVFRHEDRVRVRYFKQAGNDVRLLAARPDVPPVHLPETALVVAGVVRWVFRPLGAPPAPRTR